MTPDPVPAEYRELPPVGELVPRWEERFRGAGVPAPVGLAWIRETLEEARGCVRAAAAGTAALPARGREQWREWAEARLEHRLAERTREAPRGVINATGIVLHTNLGRAPMPAMAVRMLAEAAAGYGNLELDLESGRRCSRLDPLRRLLPLLTGAETGFAVHNNAAAVFLALTALAAGREVIVSRGQLVEIGGSFRLPEIMAASGAKLVEVGSTNRTRVADYERAITDRTALLLRVHPSNFRLIGYTAEVETPALAEVAHRHGIPLLYDVGSGALRRHGSLAGDEPRVEQAIEEGADLVCFSGDKLLGGPQAGIVVGRREWCERLARHPVARVVRLDKASLAALTSTLEAWLEAGDPAERIPLLRLLRRTEEEMTEMAERVAEGLRALLAADWEIEIRRTETEVGGGSLPGWMLPSVAVTLAHPRIGADRVAGALRAADPPVVGRIQEDRLTLEIRALLAGDEERIVQSAASLLALPGGAR